MNNIAAKRFGMDVRVKTTTGKTSGRLKVFLLVLWLDTLYTIATAFLPPQYEHFLMVTGDFAFHLEDKDRLVQSVAVAFYRLSSTLMVTFFASSNLSSIERANRIFMHLRTPQLSVRLAAVVRNCQLATLLSTVIRASLIILALVLSAMSHRERNRKYFLLPGYLHVLFFAVVYTGVNVHFMMELYLLCQVCLELFLQVNTRFAHELAHLGRHRRFHLFHSKFVQCCLLTRQLCLYIRTTYLTFFCCNLVVIVMLLFSNLFANSASSSKIVYFLFPLMELSLIIFFSHVIGRIDVRAKANSDLVYHQYVLSGTGVGNRSVRPLSKSKVKARLFNTIRITFHLL